MIDGNLNINQFEEETNGFDIKSILIKFLIHWKWIAASIIVCLCFAYFYLQKQTPVYRVQATIMINDGQKGSFQNQLQTFQQDFGLMSTTSGLDNEIEVLRSKSVIRQAVLDLGLSTRYSIDNGRFKPATTLYGTYPIEFKINREDLERLNTVATFQITQPEVSRFVVTYHHFDKNKNEMIEVKEEITSLPCTLNTPIGRLALSKGEMNLTPDQKLTVSVLPAILVAKSCLGSLSIEPTSKNTSIAYISYLDINKRRGVDFVNQLVATYNQEINKDKNIVTMKTEEFIERRLGKVSAELDEAEELVAEFKRSTGMFDVSGDAQRVIQGSSEYEKQQTEIATQLKLIEFLHDYINDPKNSLQPILYIYLKISDFFS